MILHQATLSAFFCQLLRVPLWAPCRHILYSMNWTEGWHFCTSLGHQMSQMRGLIPRWIFCPHVQTEIKFAPFFQGWNVVGMFWVVRFYKHRHVGEEMQGRWPWRPWWNPSPLLSGGDPALAQLLPCIVHVAFLAADLALGHSLLQESPIFGVPIAVQQVKNLT